MSNKTKGPNPEPNKLRFMYHYKLIGKSSLPLPLPKSNLTDYHAIRSTIWAMITKIHSNKPTKYYHTEENLILYCNDNRWKRITPESFADGSTIEDLLGPGNMIWVSRHGETYHWFKRTIEGIIHRSMLIQSIWQGKTKKVA